jgi:hypothetical protein
MNSIDPEEEEWDDVTEQETDPDIDWHQYAYQDDESAPVVTLDGKDYVALFIASLQTIFLPLVILAIVMVVLGMLFSLP